MIGKAIISDEGDALKVGYEDYSVDTFNGGDCEVTYTLNKENRDKLHAALAAEGLSGSLTDMITERFGLSMEKESFSIFCQSHQIEYELHVWID